MHPYPHIDSVYKRDEKGKFLVGEFSQEAFEYLRDKPWWWTEKIDGTNIRVKWFPEGHGTGPVIEFGGKTDNAQIPAKLVAALQAVFTPEKFFAACLEYPVCLYGEGYGAGIQKGGGLYSPEQKFILFDVKIGNFWLERDNVVDIARKLGIDVVPLEGMFTLDAAIDTIDEFASDGADHQSQIGNAPIEGFVGYPVVPLFNRNGSRVITKVKVKDFADLRKQRRND